MSAESIVSDARAAARWRLLLTPPAGGAANMALDEALMGHAARTGEWTLRLYAWAQPTLSFGRNQKALGLYDPATVEATGLRVVRRPTGGRALLHDAELTYSVTAPLQAAGALKAAYARINGLVVHALRAVGVDAHIAGATEGRTMPPGANPCFDVPAPGEIVAAGGKLAGSAQWRSDAALLQHGSILLDGDQDRVASLLRDPGAPPPRPATLRALCDGSFAVDALAAALVGAVRALEDPEASPLAVDEEIAADTRALHTRYADPAWTWRR